MRIVMLGAPGSGKGTQAQRIQKEHGLPQISTGDLLRKAVADKTPLGLRAKSIMDAGELVPDDVILGLVREALRGDAARTGAIFDGFPRTVGQAEALQEILTEEGRALNAVVALEVPADAIVERMSGRRTDPATGQVYHVRYNPPPAEVAERVIQRPDDTEATVRHRLQVYEASTAPLVAFYERSGVPVHRVDGNRDIELVQGDFLRELGR